MFATVESKLCPNVEEMLDICGEHVFCIRNEKTLFTAYTRTLASEILRKCTFKILFKDLKQICECKISQEIDDDDEVYVMDLTSPPVSRTYENYSKKYFPITWVVDNIYSQREIYTESQIFDRLALDLNDLKSEMRASVMWRHADQPSIIIDYLENSIEYDEDSFKLCKMVKTYSSLWYSGKDHPEVESFYQLMKEFPSFWKNKYLITLLESPFLLCIQREVLEEHFKRDSVEFVKNIGNVSTRNLILREYFQMISEIDESLFIPINHPAYGKTIGNSEYIRLAMAAIAGEWILDEEMDFSKCVISGSMIAACCTFLSGHYDIQGIRRLYSSAKTLVSCRDFGKIFDLNMIKTHEVDGDVLKVMFHEDDLLFRIEPCADIDMPVQVDSEEELEEVARMIYKVVSKYWPESELTYTTENRKTKMWKIVSSNMEDYLVGFRSVEIFMSAKTSCLTHHIPAVRGYFDGKNIYCTPSCLAYTLPCYIDSLDHYHYFSGKKSPMSVLEKYHFRGLQTDLVDDKSADDSYNIYEQLNMIPNTIILPRLYTLNIPAIPKETTVLNLTDKIKNINIADEETFDECSLYAKIDAERGTKDIIEAAVHDDEEFYISDIFRDAFELAREIENKIAHQEMLDNVYYSDDEY